jgi:hypothetical protein
MSDSDILRNIDELIAEEQALRSESTKQSGLDETQHQRLRNIEVQLDQCWDLLRQRRARAEFGENPDEAHARPADQVENYRG